MTEGEAEEVALGRGVGLVDGGAEGVEAHPARMIVAIMMADARRWVEEAMR
ncbi:MAG: hypothetical protein JW722_05960 [Demequinaceae bacterium]|nr:hypothetical protein [Demequinaceae bacterium]